MNQEQEQNVEQMTPLDQMIAQDQLQMLKAAIPYASFGLQPSLAILSKWLELQRTIQLFSRPADLSMMSVDAPHVSPLEMLQDISRFAAGPQRDLLSQMFQTMQMVQMLQNINPGNDWSQDPSLSGIDFARLQALQQMASQSRGKSQAEMMPFLLSLMQGNQGGAQFSASEADLIISAIKAGKSKQEAAKIDQMVRLFRSAASGKKR